MKTMQPLIREYRHEDRPTLVRLMEELQDHLVATDSMHLRRRMPEYGENYTMRLLKTIANHQGIIFLAEVDGKVVGCIAGIIEERTKEDLLEWVGLTTGRIEELHLSEGYRGQGIGKAMMETMEQYFRDHQCDVSRTEVLSDNVNAYEFYQKLGYQDRYVDIIKRL